MKIFLILIISFIFSSFTFAKKNIYPHITEYHCSKVSRNIDSVNSQMRRGYSAQQGERLRERLRVLKKDKDLCKKKRYKVK